MITSRFGKSRFAHLNSLYLWHLVPTRLHRQTTLIVAPPSLSAQWADEIQRHAPGLKVFVYEGWTRHQGSLAGHERGFLPGQERKKPKSIYVYNDSESEGNSKTDDEEEGKEDFTAMLGEYDFVITTYATLAIDLDIARPPPVRPRRSIATYSNLTRPRSPLVRCEWWRVIMDEVQMVGGGKTA